MWPYDYSGVQETPSLWFAEGFTNYYGQLVSLRAGLTPDSVFVQDAARNIAGGEANEARRYKSLADASVSTWLGYDTPQAFAVNYYGGGQAIGTLLDILIRSDTRGARSLDDLMRHLWNNEYKKGSGFTTAEFITALNTVSGRNHTSFVQRYVQGTEIPPYDSIFATVGYRLEMKRQLRSIIGILRGDSTAIGSTVSAVTPGGPYEAAGGKAGDIIISINGAPPFSAPAAALIGRDVAFIIRRGAEQHTLTVKLGSREDVTGSLIPVASPTAEQLALRKGWLARTP
jgi:predicted metalloprotease with PDZ domain